MSNELWNNMTEQERIAYMSLAWDGMPDSELIEPEVQ
jgi:hypothetical protein